MRFILSLIGPQMGQFTAGIANTDTSRAGNLTSNPRSKYLISGSDWQGVELHLVLPNATMVAYGKLAIQAIEWAIFGHF